MCVWDGRGCGREVWGGGRERGVQEGCVCVCGGGEGGCSERGMFVRKVLVSWYMTPHELDSRFLSLGS